jgi:hypothetical protein
MRGKAENEMRLASGEETSLLAFPRISHLSSSFRSNESHFGESPNDAAAAATASLSSGAGG